MTSDQFNPEQIERMLVPILRQRDYLNALVKRMREQKFPLDDPLFRAAHAADEKVQQLCCHIANYRPELREADGPADMSDRVINLMDALEKRLKHPRRDSKPRRKAS